jgi:transcriptional regulator with XRE-family HTH domain
MAIMKIKEKEEVGKFIETLRNENGWNNSELGRRLGEAKGLPDGQAVPRDTVSKWIRGDLYPGIDNIYYLAQVFGVTMEYILMAGSEYEKFDDRPFSLYAVAKSGDKERLEQLMHTENDYGGIIGENYDEFDKTILDYLIEFKQVELIKYMFEKGYLSIWGTQMSTAIRVGNLTGMEDKFNAFVDLAIEYDDVELFQYLIKPTRPILQKKEDCELEAFQETQFRRDGYVFSKQMIEKLLKTENILNSYLRSFTLTKEEWEEWNGGIVYYKSNKGRERCEELEHVPSVSASFNLVLNYLLLKGHCLSEEMLNFAIEHKKQAQLYLQGVKYMESPYPYKIDGEGRVVADSYGYGCIAYVGVVLPSVCEKLKGILKEKSKILSCDK